MVSRPPIPAELRRRLLVEAGHRCAIHTCRSTEIDIHHIVPWERCGEHAYDNLIVLCPNCHRRAGAGIIDRKSLRLYKQQLTAAIGIGPDRDRWDPVPSPLAASKNLWVAARLDESRDGAVAYDIAIEYPRFLPDDGDLAELNLVIQARAVAIVLERRRQFLNAAAPVEQTQAPVRDGYWESYKVVLRTDDLISIKHSCTDYGAGAAHPNNGTYTVNYQLSPLIPFELEDIVDSGHGAIALISQYCQADLVRQQQLTEPNEWIAEGAGPDPGNFSTFNVLQNGLLFTFDQYQVGPYADGPYQVLVDATELKPVVRGATKVALLWASG